MKKLDPKKVFFLNHCLPRESGSFAEKWHDTAGNSGNTYIMHCISKMLFNRTLKHEEVDGVANFFDSTLPEKDADRINAEYEYVLINMQDQLRPEISYYANTDARFKRINSFLAKINIPILCFGVGTNFINPEAPPLAKQLHQSQIDFIKILSDKSPGFSVRGEVTAALMSELDIPNYSLTGCPTFLLNPKNIEKPKEIKKIVFNGDVVAALGGGGVVKALNEKGVEVYFSCQDEREMVELAESLRIPTSFGGNPKIQGMNVVYLTDFDEINEFYKGIDFTIGNRIHGCVMSLNAGTPAVSCNTDLRAKEMCRLWQMPRPNTTFVNLQDSFTQWQSHDMQIAWASLKIKHDEFLEKILPG